MGGTEGLRPRLGKDYSMVDMIRSAVKIVGKEKDAEYKLEDFLADASTLVKIDQEAMNDAERDKRTRPYLERGIEYALKIVDGDPGEQVWMNDVLALGVKKLGEKKLVDVNLLSSKIDGLLGAALDLSIHRSGGYTPDNLQRNGKVRKTLGLPAYQPQAKPTPARR